MGCNSSKDQVIVQSHKKNEAKNDAVEKTVDSVIEKMWKKYDADNNGYLDLEEVKKFTIDTLTNHGTDTHIKIPSDEEMTETFKQYDKDGNNRIDKTEMKSYIRKQLGVDS